MEEAAEEPKQVVTKEATEEPKQVVTKEAAEGRQVDSSKV